MYLKGLLIFDIAPFANSHFESLPVESEQQLYFYGQFM